MKPAFFLIFLGLFLLSSCSEDLLEPDPDVHTKPNILPNPIQMDTAVMLYSSLFITDLIHCNRQIELNTQYHVDHPFRRLKATDYVKDCRLAVKIETGKCTGQYVCDTIYEIELIDFKKDGD